MPYGEDERPACKPPVITEDGKRLRWALDVHGLGPRVTLVVITDSDLDTGRITPHSLVFGD